LLLLLAACAGGCNKPAERILTPQESRAIKEKRAAEAKKWNQEGLAHPNDLEKQEEFFRKALEASPDFGEAQNNLGSVYLRQQRFYDAALAFQRAAHFLPQDAGPRYNLGLTFQKVGKYEEAAEEYRKALALAPDDLQVIENLAVVLLRAGAKPEETVILLEKALLMETRPEWTKWIRLQISRLRARGEAISPADGPSGAAPRPPAGRP